MSATVHLEYGTWVHFFATERLFSKVRKIDIPNFIYAKKFFRSVHKKWVKLCSTSYSLSFFLGPPTSRPGWNQIFKKLYSLSSFPLVFALESRWIWLLEEAEGLQGSACLRKRDMIFSCYLAKCRVGCWFESVKQNTHCLKYLRS